MESRNCTTSNATNIPLMCAEYLESCPFLEKITSARGTDMPSLWNGYEKRCLSFCDPCFQLMKDRQMAMRNCTYPSVDPYHSNTFYYVESTLFTVALLLNVMAVLAVHKTRFSLTGHRSFVISLLLSEIVICVYRLIFYASILSHREEEPLCLLSLDVVLWTTTFSINFANIVAMALDHYVGICHPLGYSQIMTKRKTRLIITIIWMAGFLMGSSDMSVLYNPLRWIFMDKTTRMPTYCIWLWNQYFYSAYALGVFTVFITITLLYLYSRIYFRVHRTAREVHRTAHVAIYRKQNNAKMAVTTGLIIGSFIVCGLPWVWVWIYRTSLGRWGGSLSHYQMGLARFKVVYDTLNETNWDVHQVLKSHPDLESRHNMWYYINAGVCACRILLCVNTIFDPMIYALRMREVRAHMIDLVCFWRRVTYTTRRKDSLLKKTRASMLMEQAYNKIRLSKNGSTMYYHTGSTTALPSMNGSDAPLAILDEELTEFSQDEMERSPMKHSIIYMQEDSDDSL